MTNQEAIETIKCALSQVEWAYPMEYAAAFDKAIEALERQDTRVLKWEEMVDAVKGHDAVFVEECPEAREPRCFWGLVVEGIDPPDRGYTYPGGVLFNVINADDDMWDGDFYGLNSALGWRAWTGKPTDEQREEVKWDAHAAD